MAVPDDSSTRSWQGIADEWVAHADTNDYRNHFLMPNMLAMVGDVAGYTCWTWGAAKAVTAGNSPSKAQESSASTEVATPGS